MTVIQIDVSLYVMCHFSLVVKILLLSLVCIIIMMCIGIDLFGHILFWVHPKLYYCAGLCLLQKLGNFQPLFLVIFFHSHSLYSPSGTLMKQVMDLLLLYQRFQGCSFKIIILYSLFSSDRVNSIAMSSSPLILSSVTFTPLLNPYDKFSFLLWLLNFSILYIPFCSFCNL